MRFLQAAIVPVLTIVILSFSGDGAEAAKGVKKNSSHKIAGKVVSVTKKNGKETVTVKTHHHKKKSAAGAGNANAAAAPKNQAAAKGAGAAAGGKKGKGHTKEFTVDSSTKITSKGGAGGGMAAAAAGKGKGKGANRGGGSKIHVGDHVMATVTANHHATSVEVMHGMKGKGKGKKAANN
jgi:hypothetical protein